MIRKLIFLLFFAQYIFSNPGIGTDCGKDKETCDSCYSGFWELFEGQCRVSDCDEEVDTISDYWCQSCKPSTPFPNYQRKECVKSDCKNIQLNDQWCSDCSDFPNKRANLDAKVCTFNCRSPPKKGRFTKEWCEVCERPNIFLTRDKTSCKSSDCDLIPDKGRYTNQFCSDCFPKRPFANLERNGCQITKVDRNLFISIIKFKVLVYVSLIFCIF